jgi:hypothetical protein
MTNKYLEKKAKDAGERPYNYHPNDKGFFARKLAATGYKSVEDLPADKKKAFYYGGNKSSSNAADIEKEAKANKYLEKIAGSMVVLVDKRTGKRKSYTAQEIAQLNKKRIRNKELTNTLVGGAAGAYIGAGVGDILAAKRKAPVPRKYQAAGAALGTVGGVIAGRTKATRDLKAEYSKKGVEGFSADSVRRDFTRDLKAQRSKDAWSL